jgi:SAM-dependent methyltransferase
MGVREHDDVRLHAGAAWGPRMIDSWLRRLHDADIRWSEQYLIATPLHAGFWVRRRLQAAIRSARARAHGVLLDVGCGRKPYAELFAGRISRYIGMEHAPDAGYRGNLADVCGDAAAIPIAASSVDTVLCTEVLEHVPDPDSVVREIVRVLKPGGVVICTAPFVYPVHDAYDFFRYSPGTIPALMRRHGLTVDVERALAGTGVTLAIMLNLYWFEIGFLWTKWLYPIGLVLRPVLWCVVMFVNLAGWLFEVLLPSNHMSFNHLTVAHRPDVVRSATVNAQAAATAPRVLERVG